MVPDSILKKPTKRAGRNRLQASLSGLNPRYTLVCAQAVGAIYSYVHGVCEVSKVYRWHTDISNSPTSWYCFMDFFCGSD